MASMRAFDVEMIAPRTWNFSIIPVLNEVLSDFASLVASSMEVFSGDRLTKKKKQRSGGWASIRNEVALMCEMIELKETSEFVQGSRTLTSFNVSHSTASSSGTSGIDINHPMYKEFMDFMKSKKEVDNNPPSYSSILMDDENIEVFDMNEKKEVILHLEENDIKWRNEPWQIMATYLDTVSYTTTVYKYRMHYEIILLSTGCEFQHLYPANTKKVYNFSKLIIKKIIVPEEWGMSTLKELDYIHPEQKVAVKYNYWDYIDGFNKVLLYENANKKHSWFIKICSNIFDRHIHNWFCKWWTLYGPSEENIFFEGMSIMYFFMEFSIPWIMKWSIEVNNTSEGFPCMQRTFYTKFWSKLLQKNPEGKLHGQEIIDLINVKISKYYDTATMEPQVIEDLSPFKKITRKLQMKKGLISKSETIAIYMEEVKKDLMKNLDIDIKDDIYMVSASHTNEEDDTCIAGEGQDVDEEEIDLETILKRYQQQLEESSKNMEEILISQSLEIENNENAHMEKGLPCENDKEGVCITTNFSLPEVAPQMKIDSAREGYKTTLEDSNGKEDHLISYDNIFTNMNNFDLFSSKGGFDDPFLLYGRENDDFEDAYTPNIRDL
ncbi:hypothetical protein H5410_057166 [Solanum commersonii]|uniref:Uncharacterized protein n=1 Tax=Solanum commersonii TaxID=4109 RepID=A0A9J5WPU0_SOLCO|nr:hypothetical protein H5410_057166 [Solanum commersonii]